MQFTSLTKEEQETLLLEQIRLGRSYLKAFSMSESDREEILQEMLIIVWRRYETLRNPEKIKSWTKAILQNQIRNFYRKRNRENLRCIPFSAFDTDAETEHPVSQQMVVQAMNRFEDTELFDLIMELGFPANTILLLHYQYSEPFEAIGKMLNMKPATVRSIAARSRQKLKTQILKKEEQTEGRRHHER